MVRTGDCTASNAHNAEVCNLLTLDMEQTTKYTPQLLSRFLRGFAKRELVVLANEMMGDQIMTVFCLISPYSRKNFMGSSELMSLCLATMFSKTIPYPVYQVYSLSGVIYIRIWWFCSNNRSFCS